MKNNKQWYSLFAIMLVAVMVLTACGGGTTEAPTSETAATQVPAAQPPTPEIAAGKTPVEVFSWWTTGGEAAGLQKLMDQFNAENPEAEVLMLQLQVALARTPKQCSRPVCWVETPPTASRFTWAMSSLIPG